MITSSFDLTCDYFIIKYPKIDFVRLNLDNFSDYEFLIDNQGVTLISDKWQLNLSEVKSIYYRKPTLPNFDNIFELKYHSFAYKEIFSTIEGIIESFDGTCLSKPSILRKANNKIIQCLLTKDIGFKMPPPKITNSKRWVFEKFNNNCIVKPISIGSIYDGYEREFVQTNMVDINYDTSYLKYCPAYFQEYIKKTYDLRVTIVGDFVFPVIIISENKIDWRKPDNTIHYEITTLPDDILLKCKLMLSHFELKFGCFDFIVKDNIYYFLELNANGQWLWLEKELKIDISEAIIKELL